MKLKDICILQKVPLLTGEKLKTLNCNDGVVKLLSAGKFNGYTTKEKSNNLFTNGDIIAISRGGSFNIKYYNGYFCSANNYILKTNSKVYTKYLYHYLLNYKDVIECFYTGWGCKRLNIHSFLNLNCTLTNIDKQKEIVRILDTLTTHTAELTAKLTAELTAELTARKKQYEYYRNQLLTFGDGVEWKKLGEVCEVSNTGVDKKINDNEKTVTLLNYVDIFRNNYIDNGIPKMQVTASDKKINACTALYGDIFITPSSEKIDEIGIASVIVEDLTNTCYSYHIMRLRLKEKNFTTSCFIRYCFESDILRSQILKNATGLTRFGLTKGRFENLQIPIPPLPVQKEIVAMLDKFDTLTNSITKGLPKEIDLRKKQYEYYRNQLLNFKEL